MRRACVPLLACLLAPAAMADEITVYRCTDASGGVALRDTPCPKGTRQQAIERQRPIDPAPAPSVVRAQAVELPAPVPQTRIVMVQPPLPLYQCTTHEGRRYTSESFEGNPRWVPLWTLGVPTYWPRNPLGDRVGAPPPDPPSTGPGAPELHPAVGIAYTPGTWIRDRCVQLPPAEACAVLQADKQRLRKEWFRAMPTRRAQVELEERRLADRITRTCLD